MRRTLRTTISGALIAATATALATSAPVAAEEIGTDDLKLTNSVDPRDAQVSYDRLNDRYLLVWDETTAGGERIRGQIVTSAGAPFTSAFDIAAPTVTGGVVFDPTVTWDSTRARWVVAYTTDENALTAFDVSVATVSATGAAAVIGQVSDMGDAAGGTLYDGREPDLAYNAVADEVLVVWRGDDDSTANGEDEIFGQRLSGAALTQVGTNDFRITTVGTNGDTNVDTRQPSVAWSPFNNRYAVVYEEQNGLVPQGILGTQLDATGAVLTSATVAAATAGVERSRAAVAANDTDGGFGVVWEAFTTATSISQIEGRVMTPSFAQGNAFPALSTAGVDASGAEIAYNTTVDRYGVAWDAFVGNEREIFGGILNVAGAIAEPVARLSTMGVNGTASTIPVTPSISAAAGAAFQVVWESDNVDAAAAPNNTAAGDIEVFGQQFQVTAPPSVTINQAAGQADPTNGSSVQFTAVFSKAVTGFIGTDVVLGGTATAGATVGVTGGPSTYTVTVSNLTVDGTITASIGANAAIDGSAQGNTASTSTDNTVTRDATAPTVTAALAGAQPTLTNAATAQFTVTFSEAVTGFAVGDVTLNVGGTASGTVQSVAGGPSVYTVTVGSLAGTGTVGITVNAGAAADPAGNTNAASAPSALVTVDRVAPTVTVNQAAGQADPTNTNPVVFTIVFSEPIPNFNGLGLSLAGSTASPGSATLTTSDDQNFRFEVEALSSGTLVVSIPAGTQFDAAGNGNVASTSTDNTVTFDGVRPGITITPVTPSPTNASNAVFLVSTTEPVVGLDAGDVVVSGDFPAAGVSLVVTSPTTYELTLLNLIGNGAATATIVDGAATDAAGNTSTGSNSSTIQVDQAAPTVTVTRAAGEPNPTNGPTVPYTVTFSEPVTGVDVSDLTLVATGTATGTVQSVSGGPSVYTVTVGGPIDGVGSLRVDLNAAGTGITDLAGNAAPGATGEAYTVDAVAPDVTIEQAAAQADPATATPVSFDVVFTEPVTGFDSSDIDLSASTALGNLVATVTGAGANYTVDVTGMTGPGTIVASVSAGGASDAAGNGNTASTSVDNTVTFDGTPPTVTVEQGAAQADPTNATPIRFAVAFSEPVTGFAAVDVVLSGTAGATTVVVSGAGSDYSIDVSGMTGAGTVIATVAAGAAIDTAGNTSLASTSTDNTVTYVPGDPNPGVNDAPIVTVPAAVAAELGVGVVMNGARLITVADPDSFNAPIGLTISAPSATLTVPASAGVTVTGGGSGSVTLVGTQAAINTALPGLSVTFTETGSIAITVTADDQGNSPAPALTATATITATVADTTPPVIVVPAVTVVANNDLGRPGATVVYQVTVTDQGRPPATNRFIDAAPPTFTCAPASGSFFTIGTTTVTCTAQDASGNTSTATFQVRVDDTERPVITVPGNQQVNFAAGARSGVVTYPAATATDNSGRATVTCSPASGSTFQAGTTTVTCTATDPSGNTATGTFLVQATSGNLPITGGGTNLVPSAFAVLLAGIALVAITSRRRRAV